jgi:acyl-coenzyme A synthetase/AMP-(fatty) acid ligase
MLRLGRRMLFSEAVLYTDTESNCSIHCLKQIEEDTGRSVTFGDLMTTAERAAHHLNRNGCRHRDVIAIFAPNSIDWIVYLLAVMRIGAVPALINSLLKPGRCNDRTRNELSAFFHPVENESNFADVGIFARDLNIRMCKLILPLLCVCVYLS